MTDSTATKLKQQLNELAKKGTKHLSQLRHRHALEQGWQAAIKSVWFYPAILLIAALVDVAELAKFEQQPFYYFGLVLIPLLVFVVRYFQAASQYEIDRRLALALYDHHLASKDRLQTADEFLNISNPSSFELAAIEDSKTFIEKALNAELPKKELSAPVLTVAKWRSLATAASLTVLAILLPFINLGFNTDIAEKQVDSTQLLSAISTSQDANQVESELSVNRKASGIKMRSSQSDSASEAGEEESQMKAKPSQPKAASDASSQNSSAQQNQSNTAGSGASSQSSSSKQQQQKKEKPATKKKTNSQTKQQDQKKQKNSSAAGVANGKGSTSGQQPANSDKAAAENKARQEDESDSTDEAEEEEDEEQKANSSSGPKKNKRKAPVDRKLGVTGQSEQENDLANGRGGPGGLKKTRGVAAMLLGVPMPDRLQGSPNPGRTKSIQEQSQPEQQQVAQTNSEDHGARNGAVGEVPEKPLLPWIKQVITKYFVAQRSDETTKQ
ncbi:hypothetical protein D5018_09955 [Parashewanella curva]|uniref:Uncharacterized protein n=1 Tax=Parashewanella curva TaxID=2338552 RepID=A0A3L8PWY6_9GAMM|nr:hypothetical protein [Parashewanella curva]RLV59884.1 hypothetical protein D5018_09955 [Parashewanella curva]